MHKDNGLNSYLLWIFYVTEATILVKAILEQRLLDKIILVLVLLVYDTIPGEYFNVSRPQI